jgi:hypothetical protein
MDKKYDATEIVFDHYKKMKWMLTVMSGVLTTGLIIILEG